MSDATKMVARLRTEKPTGPLMVAAAALIEREAARLAEARRVCDEQANDEGLWFVAVTVTEDYLQSALRRLHAAVEGTASQPSAAGCVVVGDGYCTTHKQDAMMCNPFLRSLNWKEVAPGDDTPDKGSSP